MIKIKIKNLDSLKIQEETLSNFLFNNKLLSFEPEFIQKYGNQLKNDSTTGIISNEFATIFNEDLSYKSLIPFLSIRDFYIHNFYYSLLGENYIKNLSSYLENKNLVEIGAGTDFLAKKLNENGVKIKAVDEYTLENNSYNFTNNYFPIHIKNGI